MQDQELYGSFSKEEMEKYAQEAKERWGNTEAYKESQKRVKRMGTEGLKKIGDEMVSITRAIAESMDKGPGSPEVQELVKRHYGCLGNFYDCGTEMYRGLGKMYVEDKRFAAYYEKFGPGLAEFMRQAIEYYCDHNK